MSDGISVGESGSAAPEVNRPSSRASGLSASSQLALASEGSSHNAQSVKSPSLGKFAGGSYVGGLDDSALQTELGDEGEDVTTRLDISSHSAGTSDTSASASEALSIGPSADALLRTSPFLRELLDRVVRLENERRSRKDLATQVEKLTTLASQLRGDVDFLLREQRRASELSGPARVRATASALLKADVPQTSPGPEVIRRLSEQVDALSGSVSQLMHVQSSAHSPTQSMMSRTPLSDFRPRSPVDAFRRPSSHLSPALVELPSSRTSPTTSSVPQLSPVMGQMEAQQSNGGYQTKATWQDVGLPANIARAAVQYGFGEAPSKISASTVAHILRDSDVVAQAPAVRDRLASIILPSVTYLHLNPQSDSIQILIVSSTIEQASQIHRSYTTLGIRASISAANIDLTAELANLQTRVPDVLIGLPQRLLDLLALRALPFHNLRLLVIDEADNIVARNLSDFVLSLVRILPPTQRPGGRQTAILGATVPQEVLLFASSLGLREPVRVLVKRETAAAGGDSAPSVRGIRHFYLWIAMASKATQAAALWKLEAISDLCEDTNFRQAVVWARTPETVDAVTQALSRRGIDVHSLHEGVAGQARQAVLGHFNAANTAKKVLVLSEALIGNLPDLQRVPFVVNYDLPTATEDCALATLCMLCSLTTEDVHRVSCAAAAGYARPGIAVSLITNEQEIAAVRNIEQFYRIQIAELPPHLNALG